MSLQAYQRTQTATEKPRSAEYRLFGQVTHALLEAQKTGRDDLQKMINALDWNRRLWSTLSADCATPENQLPDETRAQIISLAIFVRKHSTLVMQGKADIEPLIDINRTIMQGLGGG